MPPFRLFSRFLRYKVREIFLLRRGRAQRAETVPYTRLHRRIFRICLQSFYFVYVCSY